jgi:hypothetical protein
MPGEGARRIDRPASRSPKSPRVGWQWSATMVGQPVPPFLSMGGGAAVVKHGHSVNSTRAREPSQC